MPLRSPRLRTAWFAWALVVTLLALPFGSAGHDFPEKPALFRAAPVLNGVVVQQCAGTSPTQNACNAPVSSEACTDGCWPGAYGSLGFTGTVSSVIYGRSSHNTQVYIAQTCNFVAGSTTSVLGFQAGSCGYGSNAEHTCATDPFTGQQRCDYYIMWPPFSLAGSASSSLGTPVGAWHVTVER